MKRNDNQYIYVVLIKALTGLGGVARRFTKYDYTHIAVTYDLKANDFITFSRRKHYVPFDAGFMHEKIEHYAFGDHKRVKVKVFAIPLSEATSAGIQKYIKNIEEDQEYIFNLYSMITMPLVHGFRIYKVHNCMSFVAKIIELTKKVHMSKPYYKYNIKEMDELLQKYYWKEGYMYKEKDDKEYMNNPGLILKCKRFIELNGKLLYRMILKQM